MTATTAVKPPTSYRVTGTAQAGGPARILAADETIRLDAGWATLPTGGPGPAELLAGAFAACLLKNVARAGHLLSFAYRDAAVTVTGRMEDSTPRFVEVG